MSYFKMANSISKIDGTYFLPKVQISDFFFSAEIIRINLSAYRTPANLNDVYGIQK